MGVAVRPAAMGLPHAVFLERAARELDSSQSTFGQAAFLALRLVDLLASEQASHTQDDLFGYQAAATGRYCEEQLESGSPADHLLDLVRSASYAHHRRQPGLIAPAMLGLARWLMVSGRSEEALDVLDTLERAAGPALEPSAAIAAALLMGRGERECARFDAADAAYERAAALASVASDQASILLSWLGRANVFRGRGNLVEAERWDRDVLRVARALGQRDAEARAEHDLGVVLGSRGQVSDAVQHLWRAFQLYDGEDQSLRALQDLGVALARLGAIESAECAFRMVVDRASPKDGMYNALIELMHCASFRRDRVGFERWRGECGRALPTMAPNQLADYHLKLGIGLARFGRFDRAGTEMQLALQIAHSHGLHEFEFRIERIHAGLRSCEALGVELESITEQPAWAETLVEVSSALAGLVH